jgi:hypothetical protein
VKIEEKTDKNEHPEKSSIKINGWKAIKIVRIGCEFL